ncbi:MAG: T9SS type A sorting domain-containing protein [candidate division WOR-3 bacterium]
MILLLAYLTNYQKPINIYGQGGPDAYGYVWKDQADAPAFNWIDPSSHQIINGLADDNYVGPIPLNFKFKYYWYSTDKIWIHSNGAISISKPSNFYHPQSSGTVFPSPSAPNDIIVFMGADLDFTAGGTAYFWTNNKDSAIITFVNVKEWCPSGNNPTSHTAQVILWNEVIGNDTNSHITIQYGNQSGGFDNCGQSAGMLGVGIEAITGQVGLTYTNTPSQLTNGLVVLFQRPLSSNYQVKDLALIQILDGYGIFLHKSQNSSYNPYIVVYNQGTMDVDTFRAIITMRDKNNATVYADTFYYKTSFGPITPSSSYTVNFSKPINVSSLNTDFYSLNATILVPGDAVSANNTFNNFEIRIISNSTTYLAWDRDTTNPSITWWIGGSNGNAGFGNRFVLTFPYKVDSIRAFVGSMKSGGGQVKLALLDSSFNIIVQSNLINIPQNQAFWVSLPVNQTFPQNTTLYAAVYQWSDSTGVGVEQSPPFSYNAFEYTGAWALYRDAGSSDLYIRLYGSPQVSVSENYSSYPFKIVSLKKGILNIISEQKTSKNIEIYDVSGRKLFSKHLELNKGLNIIDVKVNSKGIYIIKIDKHIQKVISQ